MLSMHTTEFLAQEWAQKLVDIPEIFPGVHYVHLYLRGPLPSKDLFRIQASIQDASMLYWPVTLGNFDEYVIDRIVEITTENSHLQSD